MVTQLFHQLVVVHVDDPPYLSGEVIMEIVLLPIAIVYFGQVF